jgi:integrase/recombinase XerD
MTSIAPHITAFLQQRLPLERGASPYTCDSYADTFRLLFVFAGERLGLSPSALHLEHIDAPLVLAFLEHIETHRGNRISTRNVRLAAIKSFMRFAEYRVPSALDQIHHVLAIPVKRTDSQLVPYLTIEEMQAILDVPDPTTREGCRDRAMLYVGFAAGLRVSELVGLRIHELTFHPTASILVRGKGRRERALPLWTETVSALRAWLAVRGAAQATELFLNNKGEPLSRWGFQYILRKHVEAAAQHCPSLRNKRISPHVLRHSCAVTILQATQDIRKVSLWLGHASVQTTEIYTRVDPSEKIEAINKITPPSLRKGRFRPPDRLMAALKAST